MKRITTLLFALVISLSLSSCKNSNEGDKMKFDFLHNVETDVTISLGMSQEEVEALLGQGDYQDWQDAYDATKMERIGKFGEAENIIEVRFENDHVTKLFTISLSEDDIAGPSNWCAQYDLTYGNTVDNIKLRYGEGELKNAEDYFKYISYSYNASGEQTDAAENVAYSVIFYLDAAGEKIMACYVASNGSA